MLDRRAKTGGKKSRSETSVGEACRIFNYTPVRVRVYFYGDGDKGKRGAPRGEGGGGEGGCM